MCRTKPLTSVVRGPQAHPCLRPFMARDAFEQSTGPKRFGSKITLCTGKITSAKTDVVYEPLDFN